MIEIIVITNIIVGILVGIAGIAGFMLPIVFTTVLKMELYDALALSFIAFLTSGIIGTRAHIKKANIVYPIAIPIAIGSFVGALIGSGMNTVIDVNVGKLLLNSVVLLSGLSLLRGTKEKKVHDMTVYSSTTKLKYGILGIGVGAICALTGAGGPVLTIPLLTVIGLRLNHAIGVSIFNSVAIAIPACLIYFSKSQMQGIEMLGGITVITQAIGVVIGVRIMDYVPTKWLKRSVAFLAIGAASYNLINLI